MQNEITTRRRGLRVLYPSVNARIIGPFLLAIIAIAGIGIYVVTQLVAGSIQERFNNQLLDSANSAVNTITDIEREQLAVLRQMAFTDGVAEAVAAGRRNDLDIWLRTIAANQNIEEVIVFDRSASVLLYLRQAAGSASYDAPPPPDISTWESVQRVLRGESDLLGDKWVEVVQTPENTVFYFTAPVVNSIGQTTGGIMLGVRADTLTRRVTEKAISSVAITTEQGSVISSTFRTDPTVLALDTETAARWTREVQSFSPITEISVNGVPYQVLYAPFRLRDRQIGLISVGLPTNFIVEQSSTSRDIFGIIFAAFFLVVGAMGLLISRTITRPIERLVNTTRAIRSGDLSKRVRLKTPDELGELAISFDTMTDQLVKINQEVSALFEQRQAVLTSISDAVIVQDTQGDVLLRNRTAADLMDAVARDRQQRELFSQVCRSPEQLSEPHMVALAGHYYSVLATPVQLEGGSILGYVIVFRDITPLVESEQLKDELVLQMSHELRTPLAAVRGFVDLVKMIEASNISPQGVNFIDNARSHLSTLERLVNQVIDVSAMISNRFTIDIEPFNLAYLLNETFAEWKSIMPGREHQLSLALLSDHIVVEGDERRIKEVIDHLLHNSYSYTLPGGLISIQAGAVNGNAIVSIADTGVGIDADEIDKVFDRMYRGKSAEAGPTDARGLGLGLYISRQIVELHHGTIHLESEPNRGTRITISLPVHQ